MNHRHIVPIVTLVVVVAGVGSPVRSARAQSSGLVTRMSVDSAGTEGNDRSGGSAVSADGRFVAFDSAATNLVPGDTNDNTDVFVHDTATGVVQRVSIAWNGMEARDDSACPAISDDGRYVAFRSRAWNMYAGGANLGYPRWNVYVHDRQTATTTRVSRPLEGAEPEDCSCPSISADGRRVVFASGASNLVQKDDNRATDVFLFDLDKEKTKLISKRADGHSATGYSFDGSISGNGRFVAFVSTARNLEGAGLAPSGGSLVRAFVRDLATGVTEAVDVTPLQPVEEPNSSSTGVVVSDDGRFVAFESSASNIDPNAPGASGVFPNIYVRDRLAGRTALVSREDSLLDDCSPGAGTTPCDPGWGTMPSISDNGRYVAFTSYSQRLLPMSFSHASQVYLYDVLSRRLRRLTVDPTGWEAACSGAGALSSDGLVVSLPNEYGIVPQTDAKRDVYRLAWNCVAENKCRPLPACPAEPMDCAAATSAIFRLRKHPPGGIDEDRVFWRWSGAAEAEPLPDPTGDARYQLCVYAGARKVVAMDVGTPEAEVCPDGDRPCWQLRGNLQKLHDQGGGLEALTINNGESKTRILTRGKGKLLDAPFLPLTGSNGITVQLQDVTSGRCWGADFPGASIKKNFGGEPGYRSRRDGWLVAELR